jgi:hypothetical protein
MISIFTNINVNTPENRLLNIHEVTYIASHNTKTAQYIFTEILISNTFLTIS